MTLPRRIAATLGLGLVALVTLVFVGTQVTNCLGPLGRTLVQSLADGCSSLYEAPATLVGPAFIVVAVLLWFPPREADVRAAVLGALIGAAIAFATYASLRATSMTGPISSGEITTVILPFDWVVAARAAIVAGSAGWLFGITASVPDTQFEWPRADRPNHLTRRRASVGYDHPGCVRRRDGRGRHPPCCNG